MSHIVYRAKGNHSRPWVYIYVCSYSTCITLILERFDCRLQCVCSQVMPVIESKKIKGYKTIKCCAHFPIYVCVTPAYTHWKDSILIDQRVRVIFTQPYSMEGHTYCEVYVYYIYHIYPQSSIYSSSFFSALSGHPCWTCNDCVNSGEVPVYLPLSLGHCQIESGLSLACRVPASSWLHANEFCFKADGKGEWGCMWNQVQRQMHKPANNYHK